MPSGVSYLKKDSNIVDSRHRLEMTKIAIEGMPHFLSSDLEIRRKGNTYTADTLEILNKTYPEDKFYFIMGADSLFGLKNWKEPEKIAKLCTLAAVVRDDVDFEDLQVQKQFLEQEFDAKIVLVPFHKINISSSGIREKLLNRESVDDMLSKGVIDYIHQNNLYEES